jgi:TPR repeat protein
MRSITPDPAMARQWYQRAAELGSSDARRRLSQLQN